MLLFVRQGSNLQAVTSLQIFANLWELPCEIMDGRAEIKYSIPRFCEPLSMENIMSEQVAELEAHNSKPTLSIKEAIAYLAEKFPLCFSLEGEAKPLKIGLFQELADAVAGDEKISKTQLRQVLRAYTSNWRYLHGCKEGAIRVGLQGEEAGVVDATQAEHAAQTLEQAKAAFAEKKALQRKEQRKEFFKQQAKEANAKKRAEMRTKKEPAKASLESLAALESKFSKH